MTALFDAQWEGLPEVVNRFERLPATSRQRIRQIVRDLSELIAETAYANMRRLFKGPVAYIDYQVTETGDTITGTVTAGGTPYARIHEYGGTVHTPEIFPVNAQALHWVSKGGDEVFARHAAAHDTKIPERSYLRAAIEQREADIMRAFQGIGDELNRAA